MRIIDPHLHGTKFKNESFTEPVRIQINKDSYDKLNKPRVSLSSLSFEKCSFHSEVSISTQGRIPMDFHITFSGCLIDSFEGSLIEAENIQLFFRNNIINHFVSKSNLKSIQIFNSLGTFFIENCASLNIEYDPDSIRYNLWKQAMRLKKDIFSIKTQFYLEKNISTYINFNKYTSRETGYFACPIDEQIKDYQLLYFPSISEISKTNISFNLKFNESDRHTDTLIQNANLDSLSITGTLNGKLDIENISVNKVFLRKLNPKGTFNFMNVKGKDNSVDKKFEIHKSILKNTLFYGIRFDSFNSIAFYKSSFSEAKFTSTVFPKAKRMNQQIKSLQNIHSEEKSSDFYREQYDLFLELKLVFDKSGNVYEAQKMKAVAFNALKNVKEIHKFNDQLILYLNNISNRHGTAPWIAVCWIIGFVILFHTINILSFESIYFDSSSKNTMRIIHENIQYITVIANPVHRISELAPKNEITSQTYFVSFTSRIVIAFFIYQFIAAFRRFGKT